MSFVVHPSQVPDELATAPLGTRYMIALAEIGDDEEPVEPRPNGRERYRAAPTQEQALMRAAALTRDPRFRAWVAWRRSGSMEAPPASERACIEFIREECCEGGSRSLIADDQGCYERFLSLELAYRIAVGQAAEPR